jgi:hypothetical protein
VSYTQDDELREHLRKALRTAGFIDPDDGTVPMWPQGDVYPNGPVWVSWRRLVDAIINNLPAP